MPLKLTIDHDLKLVLVVAEGEVTLRDMEEHFDRLMVEEVFSYAKLFDATDLVPVYSEHDMYVLGGRLSAYSQLENGPLAIVAKRDAAVLATERFLNMSMSNRPAAIFNSLKKARAWLDERR
jgi:hypothetical protein